MRTNPISTRDPVAILSRISTQHQEDQRQLSELTQYAKTKGYRIVEVCRETVSGDADGDDRRGLKRIEELAESGSIKKVLTHEVSRIARRNSVAHSFLEKMERCGVSIYWHSQNIETLLPNGKRNPAASIMFSLLAELARAERETLRERILSGLAQAKRAGRKLGRPTGSILTPAEMLQKHRDIVRLLKAGHSIRNAAKIAGKGVSTVQRLRNVLS
jgi:DNA invertase Pin-like site-specific DNA recombinase